MTPFHPIQAAISNSLKALYEIDIETGDLKLDPTPAEFEGQCTFVVFPFLKSSKKNPVQTATELGDALIKDSELIESYNVVKGFLNLELKSSFWLNIFDQLSSKNPWESIPSNGNKIVLEYCGPNTNKPLHLGHIRNMLLGYSISRILEAAGNEVHRVNIYNDRGIAICKSMVAYLRLANGSTPEQTGIKGDHFVGKYYVEYSKEFDREVNELIAAGEDKESATRKAPIYLEAVEALQKWENNDTDTIALWKTMNNWVYKGFNETFENIGVSFEKDYLESEHFAKGRKLVLEGLEKDIFFKKPDGSVWVDLTDKGLDEKVLLRSDGTSVYITQDIGVAHQRYLDYKMDTSAYVVANEQDYHFKVLKLVLEKLEEPYADGIFHMSYGMVDLPEGKMKSREGTVVDADDLIEEMRRNSKEFLEASGKQLDLSDSEKSKLYEQVGLAALKYFILRVDPKKRMLFNPAESIDLQGNTGPFIQYTYARIQSVIRKAGELSESNMSAPDKEELALIALLARYEATLLEAAQNWSPATIANFAYSLAKQFNKFYSDHSVLHADTAEQKALRLRLSLATGNILKHSLGLLGIEAPERM